MTQQPASPQLPTAKTTPTLTLETAKVLLYGPPKVGKTTLAAGMDPDRTLFIATEAGLGGLSVYAVPIGTWDEFRALGARLAEGDHPFTNVVVDTVDNLAAFCSDKVCADMGVTHPSDLEYGKGWRAVSDEFKLRIARLTSLGAATWFISHSQDRAVKTRVGEITVTGLTIGGAMEKFLTGFVDYILLARSEQTEHGERRVIRTRATENYEAGSRGAPLPDPILLPAIGDDEVVDPVEVAAPLREAMAAATSRLAQTTETAADGQAEKPPPAEPVGSRPPQADGKADGAKPPAKPPAARASARSRTGAR
jgi:hypothetical protein